MTFRHPDIDAMTIAIEDEYAAVFGARCSTADARRLAHRAAQAVYDGARPNFRKILAPWINGSVSFSEWCEEVDRWFPPPSSGAGQ